ncbi:ACT domain-containing protein [Goodfellowiella coeruleoviolacea]|uniref:Uncharacterized protein n=1 Tax=Goodfellowiella coeruleoviolacea TaxID=334858 RepID=A0AAE3GLA7_9PSEU|nr:ACT domain-containing protein [Goodfellowiella coeruleoviolacea]MCP2169587.1 hypothetical protein [Goodfellowiella coeruleoviolacea]
MKQLTIDVEPDDYTVARLDRAVPVDALPLDLPKPAFVSVTRTAEGELSLVCPTEFAPAAAVAEPGWRLLSVRGPLEFTLTGIMAALAGALAAAGVALFAVSTFDTDHLLVKQHDLESAVRALRAAGHRVHLPTP